MSAIAFTGRFGTAANEAARQFLDQARTESALQHRSDELAATVDRHTDGGQLVASWLTAC